MQMTWSHQINILNNAKSIEYIARVGRVGKWFTPAVLKTAVSKGTVGSNPTPSATFSVWKG